MKIEGKNKLGAVFIITLMCMMAFGAVLMTVPDNAQAAYWYPNYEDGGRQQYTITNAELTAATNVTADIYITEANNPEIFDDCLSTGYDILFTNFDSNVRYEHYTAYWDYADHDALFQVLIPSIAASTTIYIWIYYGYAAATDLSDGDAVFGLFDDFDYGTTYRDVDTDGLVANAGGSIYSKVPTLTYSPDSSVFETSQEKMMGVTTVNNVTEGSIISYGSYMNASYACILGANSTSGYDNTWTEFTNVMVNHSTTADDPDFLKATEPDFLTNISASHRRNCLAEYDTDKYAMLYSGLNATNYSINLATSLVFDASWTKYASNPVISNGTLGEYDDAGCRKPVFWKEGDEAGDYRCLYSGLNSTTLDWEIGYATSADMTTWVKPYTWSVFNGSTLGWDNGADLLPLDIHHDGSFYELIYSCNGSADNISRIGVAYSADLITWSTWGGIAGIGDSSDWDGFAVQYGTYFSMDANRYSLYHTGTNISGNVQLGIADAHNSTITDWSSWQNDGTGYTCYFVNAEDQLEVQHNQTLLERAVDLANYSVTVDMWGSIGDHNITLFMRSDGGTIDSSEDYYGLAINTSDSRFDVLEWAAGVSAILENQSFVSTGVEQHMLKITAYGGSIYTYVEGMDSNVTASNETYDETLDSGEIGLRVSTNDKVKFDNFRTLTTTNGTITVGAGTAYDWSAELIPGGGGTEIPIPTELIDDTLEVGSAWDDIFSDWCGAGWWIILIGALIFLAGIVGTSFFGGVINRNQAIVLGAVIMAIGYSLKSGSLNWLVIVGSVIIVVDMVFKVPIPYLQKPMATILGVGLIVFGLLFWG